MFNSFLFYCFRKMNNDYEQYTFNVNKKWNYNFNCINPVPFFLPSMNMLFTFLLSFFGWKYEKILASVLWHCILKNFFIMLKNSSIRQKKTCLTLKVFNIFLNISSGRSIYAILPSIMWCFRGKIISIQKKAVLQRYW